MSGLYLNDDIILNIYSYDFTLLPFNKLTRKYLNNHRNNSACIIQKMFRKNKIYQQLPILFTSELYEGNIPKWLIIRIYMKFYPKCDLCMLPLYLLKNNYSLQEIMNDKKLKKMWFRFNQSYDDIMIIRKYEIFKIMHDFTVEQLIKMGF
jgi:hypothetical protein